MSLNNILEFSTTLESHPLKWKFEDANGMISKEFEDQIIPLTREASQFLWNFEKSQRQFNSFKNVKKYFKEYSELKFGDNDQKKVKKWLYQRGIPFKQHVYWITQPEFGFILTWKMVIKFVDELFFANDGIIWDQSLNWVLVFDHEDLFCFGRDYDGKILNKETEVHNQLINDIKSRT